MKTLNYDDVRTVLNRSGFGLVRKRKHEIWEKRLADGRILRVSLSHKTSEDVPPGTFHAICKQMGLTPEEFFRVLKRR